MINFCHITPTPFLEVFAPMSGAHLILAHLVESDPVYAKFYADLDDGKPKIMDNSAFEMFKLGHPMYPSEKLIEMGNKVRADYIVMTDYPKEHWKKTVDMAKEMMPKLKAAGFKTFFCPQSELGDMEGLLTSMEWALKEPNVDLVGLSILACPIACGVNETTFSTGKRSDAYKMQRFLSRWKVLTELKRRGSLKYVHDKFHCLGMVDGPNEIDLLSEFHQHIYSWDSSAAVWAGLNYIRFDQSPSGLMEGKFEHEVDFDHAKCDLDSIKDAMYNCSFINKKVK
jgi:hypothetical protein